MSSSARHGGAGAGGGLGGLGGSGGEGGGGGGVGGGLGGDGGGGEGGGGGCDGGRVGEGGGPAPQLTVTCASAASPWYPLPRMYVKVNAGEWTATVISVHQSPWSPLRLHSSSPAALVTRSLPMLEPYMW